MPSLPTRLIDVRKFFQALDWDTLSMEVEEEAHARLAIVGPVNSGKSTLFNLIKGRKVSAVKAVPGTTQGIVTEEVGPFTLIDTPGFGEVGGVDRAALAQAAAEQADVAILVLDASAGLRQSDYDLYESLQAIDVPVVVAMNKIDLIKRDLADARADVERKLATTVIPISAKDGTGVAEKLIPAIVEAHPWMAVALGRYLPPYRRQISRRLVRNASILNGVIAAGPVPILDIPLLLTSQVRMVLRIGAIYGEAMSVRHARELLTTMAGSVGLRYLATTLGKFVPGPGWLIAAAVTGMGTWAMGHVAISYFESGKRLSSKELRERYKQIMRRPRKAIPIEEDEDVKAI